MILSNYVKIKISNNQIRYYKNKGYDVKGGNEELNIKVLDLPSNSGVKIKVRCDICGNEKEISLNRYNINTKKLTKYYACSRKCAEKKNKDTILDKYGVENISKSEKIKSKKIETCLSNFGVEYPQQSDIILKRGKKTKLEKYGDENYTNIEKAKNTNLIKYGVEYPSQNIEILYKMKENQFLSYKKVFDLNLYKSKIIKDKNDIFVGYVSNGQYEFKCDLNKGHNFLIDYKLLWNRINNNSVLCTKCNVISKNISGLELQINNFITQNYNKTIITNTKKIINPLELDIYIPELKLAFEFNGLYWHNELNKEKKYHLNKTDECEKNDIQLINIYEDDWLYKQDIVKSMILNKLNKTSNRIYARKTKIEETNDITLIKNFLEKNHIQGYVQSSVKLGLFYDDELVSLMTFGKRRVAMGKKKTNSDEYELLRFCNKLNTNVIGGASKLFKFFINNYKPKEITTYADRSYSNGNLYKQLGFDYIGKTDPNYYYIIDGIRHHRFNFRKDKLIKEGYDKNKTEHQIMIERNTFRIYNSGNLKFFYKRI
jgi:hypothetical protein